MADRRANRVTQLILMSLATKLLVDTSVQIFNPYLPTIADGLGMDIVTLGRFVALRSAVGLVVPLIGAMADRVGYRPVIRLCLGSNAVGLLVLGVGQGPWAAGASMALMGVGAAGFVPTLHAYLSRAIPYGRRGRGLGTVEYAWALAGIVGLWPLGYLMAWAGWRAAFLLLAVVVGVAAIAFGRSPRSARSPEEGAPAGGRAPRQDHDEEPSAGRLEQARAFFRLGDGRRSAWGAIATGTLLFFAGTNVQLVYGGWLERDYGLATDQLGVVALLVAVALLVGSVTASLVSDRLGKRRSVLVGLGALVGADLLLPLFNVGTVPAVVGTMLVLACLEFTIVSHIPLMSEQVPAQRGKVLALGTAGGMVGRTLGSLTGPWALAAHGIGVVGPLAAAIAGTAFIVGTLTIRDAPNAALS